jgi:hypothetical protein
MFTPVTEYEERKIKGVGDFKTAARIQKDFWRERFLELNDPTGYNFSEAWLEGGYRCWDAFQKGYGAAQEVKEWKDTLAIKMQAESIISIAKQRDSFQALKWLADRGWEEKMDKRTKEAKKKAEAVEERTNRELQEDMARLGLRRVK